MGEEVRHNRLQELLSSFSTECSNNRHLVDRLRRSIQDLQQLRDRLQQLETHQGLPRLASDRKPNAQQSLTKQFGLTRREAEVAKLLGQGRSNQAIARELNISQHTARHHTQRILSKLEVHSRGEAGAKIRSSFHPERLSIGTSAYPLRNSSPSVTKVTDR